VRLGIIANTGKPRIREFVEPFLRRQHAAGISCRVASDLTGLIGDTGCEIVPPEMVAEGVDYVLSFGGDGTFLQTARLVAPAGKPIIGVNLGGFGYLAEVNIDEIDARLDDLKTGRYREQERMMLEAVGEGIEPVIALNDIVIDKGAFTRTIRLETRVDGEFLNEFYSDGLIIATPTGSTGYSLSVGGPIVEPRLDAIIVNPISPHMLANRPLLLSPDRRIEIAAYSEQGWFSLSADGRKIADLPSGATIRIRRSPFVTRVVTFRAPTFFTLLRNKLHWRNRHNGEDNKLEKVHAG